MVDKKLNVVTEFKTKGIKEQKKATNYFSRLKTLTKGAVIDTRKDQQQLKELNSWLKTIDVMATKLDKNSYDLSFKKISTGKPIGQTVPEFRKNKEGDDVYAKSNLSQVLPLLDKAANRYRDMQNSLNKIKVLSKEELGLLNKYTGVLEKEKKDLNEKASKARQYNNILDKTNKKLQEQALFNKGLKIKNGNFFQHGELIDTSKGINKMTNEIENLSKKQKKASKKTSFWSMSLLSFMFNIQKVQASLQRLATSSISAFLKVTDSSNIANRTLSNLGIGFESIRIAIGSSLGTALAPFADKLMETIMVINDWIIQQPKLTSQIILGGLALSVMALALIAVAMMFNSLQTLGLIGFFSILIGKLGRVTKEMTGLNKFLAKSRGFLILLIIIGSIIAIVNILKSDMSALGKTLASIGVIAFATAMIFALFGLWIPALIALGIAAVAALGSAIWENRDKIKLWFLEFKKGAYDLINVWFKKIIDGWNWIRGIFNKEPIKITTDLIDVEDLDKKIADQKDLIDKKAKARAKKKAKEENEKGLFGFKLPSMDDISKKVGINMDVYDKDINADTSTSPADIVDATNAASGSNATVINNVTQNNNFTPGVKKTDVEEIVTELNNVQKQNDSNGTTNGQSGDGI